MTGPPMRVDLSAIYGQMLWLSKNLRIRWGQKFWHQINDSGKCGFLSKGHEIMMVIPEQHSPSKTQSYRMESVGLSSTEPASMADCSRRLNSRLRRKTISGKWIQSSAWNLGINVAIHCPSISWLSLKKFHSSCWYPVPIGALHNEDSQMNHRAVVYSVFSISVLWLIDGYSTAHSIPVDCGWSATLTRCWQRDWGGLGLVDIVKQEDRFPWNIL
jgi:hypothetical protein